MVIVIRFFFFFVLSCLAWSLPICPIQRAQGVTEWFDEYENYANHMLWPFQSPDLNPVTVSDT